MKTTTRRNSDGRMVRYLHLAHNEWDATAGRAVPKILYSFGREDRLDQAAIRRLVAAFAKLLDPGEVMAATAVNPLHDRAFRCGDHALRRNRRRQL